MTQYMNTIGMTTDSDIYVFEKKTCLKSRGQ